jgi:hypothetical protein
MDCISGGAVVERRKKEIEMGDHAVFVVQVRMELECT